MEFPSLGTYCAWAECHQLDFLPFKCDMCQKVFCKDHKFYDQHQCPDAHQKDVRVPTCPMCGAIVPVARGEDPNIKMNDHIANNRCVESKLDAPSANTNIDPAKRCFVKGCKRVDMVQVRCDQCGQQFCLRHRGPPDHKCEGKRSQLASAAARRVDANAGPKTSGTSTRSAQPTRLTQKTNDSRRPQQSLLNETGRQLEQARRERQTQQAAASRSSQPAAASQRSAAAAPNPLQMSEDEALARALQESIQPTVRRTEQPPSAASSQPSGGANAATSREDADLQRAIAASLEDKEKKEESSCVIS